MGFKFIMADDMLMSFDSPAAANAWTKVPNQNGLSSPLIPCPQTPFDLISSRPGDDPFDLEPQNPYVVNRGVPLEVKTRTPELSRAQSTTDGPMHDATTPSPLLLRRTMSDVDISGVVPGQYLVSSTPLVSNANTPTRSPHSVVRRSVLNGVGSISCAQLKSKLDFINKVNQNLTTGKNPCMTRSKSVTNLTEILDSSVQHKIFSSSKGRIPQGDITRGVSSTYHPPPLNSSAANCYSFLLDKDDAPLHENSNYMSFLVSPVHQKVLPTPTSPEVREEARKIQTLFELCFSDDHKPPENEVEEEWIESTLFPNNWFDETLDFDNINTDSDSDEDVTVTKLRRSSTQEEMEAIKIRLNRFRRSVGPDESTLVAEDSKVDDSVVKTVPAPVAQPEAHIEPKLPPLAAPTVAVPKMPLVPEMKSRVVAPSMARKGPLKAVEPVPNMIKKSSSSDLLLKSKPTLPRGRLSRPQTAGTEQNNRRQLPPKRSTSSSPHRSSTDKSLRPPVKLPGVRPKPVAVKGKENRT